MVDVPSQRNALIFLDLDGVLNSQDWYNRRGDCPPECSLLEYNVDPLALQRLTVLCKATGARLVFSSTWRCGYTLRRLNRDFKALGLGATFVGITPQFRGQQRGAEIQAWLDEHGPVGAFAILDDDNDMGDLLLYLVRTDHNIGLSDTDVRRAVALLRSQSAAQ